MKEVGSTVKIKDTDVVGVINGYSKLVAGFFSISAYSEAEQKYIDVHAHPMRIMEVHTRRLIGSSNSEDHLGHEMWAREATEMALAMKDKQWFEEIQEARLALRASRFMDDETYQENVQQILVELAVDTKDEAWYQELIDADKLFD